MRQLRHLRETIPRVAESVLVDPAQPDLLHAYFTQAAKSAAKDLKDFKQLMDDVRSKDALEQARASRARDNEGISGWLVTEHDDWLDVKKEDSNDDLDMAGNEEDTKAPDTDVNVEGIKTALEKLEKSHRGITTVFNAKLKTMMVRALHSALKLETVLECRYLTGTLFA